MDADRFDALTRTLTNRAHSRRRLLGGLLAGVLGSLRMRTTTADDSGTAIADASGGGHNLATLPDPAISENDRDDRDRETCEPKSESEVCKDRCGLVIDDGCGGQINCTCGGETVCASSDNVCCRPKMLCARERVCCQAGEACGPGDACCPLAQVCLPSAVCCPTGEVCAPGGGVCCAPERVCLVGGVPDACCASPAQCINGVCQ